MRASSITARDLSEAWFFCLREVLAYGYEYKIDRGSYAGQKRKELDMITVQILNPENRPIIPDVPPGVPPPSTMEYLDHYLPYLMTGQRAEGEQYTYGQYLESQISEVIRMYKEEGYNTNQAFMTVGNPEAIYLSDPPCLRSVDTRIRYGKLHFVVYFRSWDLWAGFPSNLAALQLLKEYMAAEIGVDPGETIAVSKGMHLYDYAWDIAKTACGLTDELK
ncbi:thymidylate synthase [Dehalogenimonas etheniformans]|uniref:Thymidylate synthase n=1 Tax=Dehalogenimonas etheniformans TaxID=1536648 RepID=A0A2P5P673_9CHLR|nr:thymidylate synthase [Dehalogenimonas etheniformans]PPD57808.1 thymidylate synthase [Dehalogenimonas etheniformans]QNT76149.1 thymidylate synthase [Dehalogenimonas etheniformans]